MSIIDIGIVHNNPFDKVIEIFATRPEVNRVVVGMKVPESWIKTLEDRSGYVIMVCQFFDQVLSVRVKGRIEITKNDALFGAHTYSYPGYTDVNLKMVTRNDSWKVIAKTTIGRAEFTESSVIFGHFDRRGSSEFAPQEISSTPISTPETHRRRIFNSILEDLNKKFGNVSDLAHHEVISVSYNSPTTQELIKFLEENGYHTASVSRVGGHQTGDELRVYL